MNEPSEPKPIWIIPELQPPWPDERFDGLEPWMADPIRIGVDHPHYKPPLDPQQEPPTDDKITWHLLARDDGSISVYWTCPGMSTHFVVWDSLDEPKRQEEARIADAARAALPDILRAIGLWFTYSPAFPLSHLNALRDLLQAA